MKNELTLLEKVKVENLSKIASIITLLVLKNRWIDFNKALSMGVKLLPSKFKWEAERLDRQDFHETYKNNIYLARDVLTCMGEKGNTAIQRLFRGYIKSKYFRKKFYAKTGHRVPGMLFISPTTKCNLSCDGCFNYQTEIEDMGVNVFKALHKEAMSYGVIAFSIIGGEPMLCGDIMDYIARDKSDSLFIIFTNGTIHSTEMVDAISQNSNVVFAISIEGPEIHTDERRGDGVYNKTRVFAKLLEDKKIPYFYSITLNSENRIDVSEENFLEMLDDRLCIGLIYFDLMLGNKCSNGMNQLTTEEHNEFRKKLDFLKSKTGLYLFNFPADEKIFWGECIGGGNKMLHINAFGAIEPCPFVKTCVSDLNIYTDSFLEILKGLEMEGGAYCNSCNVGYEFI